MKELERVLKALANYRRLAILRCLKREPEASVGKIAGEIRLSFKATSKHLRILSNADLLEKDQRSLVVYYRLANRQRQFVSTLLNQL